MGEEFTVEPDSQKARYLKVNVYGTSPIETVNIVKNSRTLESIPGHEQLDVEISYSDPVFGPIPGS